MLRVFSYGASFEDNGGNLGSKWRRGKSISSAEGDSGGIGA